MSFEASVEAAIHPRKVVASKTRISSRVTRTVNQSCAMMEMGSGQLHHLTTPQPQAAISSWAPSNTTPA